MMSGTGSYTGILLKNYSLAMERSERRVGNGIGHTVVGASPTAFRPHEVILSVTFQHERTFYIVLRSHFFIDCAIIKRNDTK